MLRALTSILMRLTIETYNNIRSWVLSTTVWPLKNLVGAKVHSFQHQTYNYLSLAALRVEFLPTFYSRNENMWVDGMLIDFLQKKVADAWIRRFVIFTGYLFSERYVFENIVRFYLDNFLWQLHANSMSESTNVATMLNTTLFLYLTLYLLVCVLLTIFL